MLYGSGGVHRRPRRSLKSFFKMLMTYGRGRAEQFRLNPTFGSALNFVPPLFCLYLVALALFAVMPVGPAIRLYEHAAQNQRASGNQPMRVVTCADAEHKRTVCS